MKEFHSISDADRVQGSRYNNVTLFKVKRMQRSGAEAIRIQIKPSRSKRGKSNIANSQNTKRTYGLPSEQLFSKRRPFPDLSPIEVPCMFMKCRAISLVVRENNFIQRSSCIHIRCVVAQSSLAGLCKTVNGTTWLCAHH